MIRLLYSYNSLRVTDRRCGSAELSCRTDWFVYVAGFYSQLASRVTRARSAQAVVYLECHVVSFEYFRVIVQYNNRLHIMDQTELVNVKLPFTGIVA